MHWQYSGIFSLLLSFTHLFSFTPVAPLPSSFLSCASVAIVFSSGQRICCCLIVSHSHMHAVTNGSLLPFQQQGEGDSGNFRLKDVVVIALPCQDNMRYGDYIIPVTTGEWEKYAYIFIRVLIMFKIISKSFLYYF